MEKIQRGAGTSDESEITKLVEQLQTLISDERWHHVSKRMEALEKFDKRVVEAFYDCMPNPIETYSALDIIELPSLEEGYANIALIGMSGCGKTSTVRKLMGTTDKNFPTTSTNRTTTCDIQIIRAKVNKYEMAVQFVARNEVESDLRDNLQDSIKYILAKNKEHEAIDDTELLLTIMNHSEMSTRLTYTLGMPEANDDEDDEDDDLFEEEEDDELLSISDYEIDVEKKDKF